jgi:PAS domain S-box-containing protein
MHSQATKVEPIESWASDPRRRSSVENVDALPHGLREDDGNRGNTATDSIFRTTFERAAVGLAHVSPTGEILEANPCFCEMVGYSRAELLGLNVRTLWMDGEVDAIESRRAEILAGATQPYVNEKRYRRKDGSTLWVRIHATLVRDCAGIPLHFVGVVEDISDRRQAEIRLQRVNRLYSVLRRVGAAIVGASDRQQLMNETCRIAVELGGLRMVAVVALSPGATHAVVLANYGDAAKYIKDLEIDLTGTQAHGTIGTALRTGSHDVCNDVLNDPRMRPWLNEARLWEFRAVAAFPLKKRGATVAALALFADETDCFQDDEVELLLAIASDLSFALDALDTGIEFSAARSALLARTSSLIEAQRVAKLGNWEWDIGCDEVLGSDELLRIMSLPETRYAQTYPIDRLFQAVHADDRKAVRDEFARSVRHCSEFALEHRVETPDAGIRIVHLRGRVLADASGRAVRMVGTAQDITERRTADEELRRSEELLRIAGQTARIGGWTFDVATRELRLSDIVCEIRELPLGTVLAVDSAQVLYSTECAAEVDAAMLVCVNEGTPFDLEVEILTASARRLWVRTIGKAVRAADGTIIRVQGAFQDISERRRADIEARRAELARAAILTVQRSIAASESSPDELTSLITEKVLMLTAACGCSIDLAEGEYLVFSAGVGALAGTQGTRLRRQGSLSGLAMSAGEVMVCGDTETDPRVDRQTTRRLGARSLVIAPIRDDSGVRGVLKACSTKVNAFTASDVSTLQILAESLGAVFRRQRAAEMLRASEAQYRLMFYSNPHPMWVADIASLRFVAVNTAAIEHYGYTEQQFLSMTIADIRAPDERQRLMTKLSDINAGTRQLGIWQHVRRDGSIIDVEITSDGISFDNRPSRLVLAHDVTQRLAAERELVRVNRAQRLLSRGVDAMMRAQNETSMLADICRIAVDIGGYDMAWVGYAQNDDARTISPMAHAGAENGYLSSTCLNWSPDSPTEPGPIGQTIISGLPTLATDIQARAANSPWHERAHKHGFGSVICLPLKNADCTFGLFCLHMHASQSLASEEIDLLQELADDIAFGIENRRAQGERKLLQNAVVKVAAGVSESTGVAFFEQLVRNTTEALGAEAGLIARIDTGDSNLAQTIKVMRHGQAIPNFSFQLDSDPPPHLLGVEVEPSTDPARAPISGEHNGLAAPTETWLGQRLENPQGALIGFLYVVYRSAPERSELANSMLQIFSARAAAELERLIADARILEQASLLDEARDAIVVLGASDGRIRYWNRGAQRLYGWAGVQAIGQVFDVLLQIDSGHFNAALQRVLDQDDWSGELHQRRMDQSAVIVEASCSLARDSEGRPSSILAIMSDITARRQAEDGLQRALLVLNKRNRQLQDFAFVASHDLQEPLRKIRAFSDRLVSLPQSGLDEKARDYLQRSARAAERMQTLIDDLLDYSRIDSRDVAFASVDLAALFATVIDDLSTRIDSTSADVQCNGLPTVEGDPTQLRQLFQNLIANALKFHHPQRTPRVRVHAETARTEEGIPGVRIFVEDNGIGFDEKYAERIFAPFHRLHSREEYKGTGIGLAIVRRIVERHHGSIRAQASVGEGAVFQIVLPLQQPRTGV